MKIWFWLFKFESRYDYFTCPFHKCLQYYMKKQYNTVVASRYKDQCFLNSSRAIFRATIQVYLIISYIFKTFLLKTLLKTNWSSYKNLYETSNIDRQKCDKFNVVINNHFQKTVKPWFSPPNQCLALQRFNWFENINDSK